MIISVVGQSPRAALVYEPGESGSFFEKSPNLSRIFTVPADKANAPCVLLFLGDDDKPVAQGLALPLVALVPVHHPKPRLTEQWQLVFQVEVRWARLLAVPPPNLLGKEKPPRTSTRQIWSSR